MLVDIVDEMNNRNIHVEVLVLSKSGDFYSEKVKSIGIPIYYGKVNEVYHPSHLQTVRVFMKKNYDIIHAHLFAPQLYVALAKKTLFKDIKIITTEHSTNNRRRERKIFKPLDRFMYNQYDRIIAITKGTEEELNTYLPLTKNKTIVIENGIKLNDYKFSKSIKRSNLVNNYCDGDVLVLMVAAMREEKDHETVIRASKLLPSNYHIVFVGEGERMEIVQLYAKENGTSRIHFLGRRSDIPEIMKTCDVFVLSSHWEGFGLVAVEAMAAGLPVIASNVEGLREVVDGGGLLFMPGDSKDLTEKVLELCNDEEYRVNMIERGYEKSISYSIQENVRQQIEVYKEFCK